MNQSATQNDEYKQALRHAHQLRRSKSYAEAADAFLAAASSAQNDQETLLFHATSLKEAGKDGAANDAYQALLKKHPSYATGWSLYGVFLKNKGDHVGAISALRRSLELKDDIATLNALVVSLYKAGRMEEAQVEGLRNLHLKDALALEHSAKSPARTLRLDTKPRPFDPKARHRNIISFSLWGDDPVYIHGAIVNARIAPHIYYGWTARFYCDSSVPADAIDQLRQAGAQIAMVRDPALRVIRPMWRFLVSDDPDVDWFICRDADSRLNCQELIAVEEWLRSGRPFHVMRDHIYHMDLMLAGMWGGAAGVLPNLRQQLLAAPQYFNNRFADQDFLMREVWPLLRGHAFTHDTYYQFHGGREFPFGYRLPRPIHVGGAIKQMPEWKQRV